MIKKFGKSELSSKIKVSSVYKNISKLNNRKIEKETLNDLGFEAKLLGALSNIDDYSGIFSTNQLKDSIDFSKFENHVFYDSAEAKVNYAFSRIINNFPFEGSYEDYVDYITNIDGFTSYVLDNIKKHKGHLRFSDSYIEVKDQNGFLFSTSDSKNKGFNVLDPKLSQFSFDFWIYVPDSADTNQIVFQKKSTTHNGFTCLIDQVQNSKVTLSFLISNKLNSTQNYHNFIKQSITFDSNKYVHICINIKNTLGKREIDFFVDGIKQSTSSSGPGLSVEEIDFRNDSLFIGKGSNHIVDPNTLGLNLYTSFNVSSTNSLNAYLDELRFFHTVRSSKVINQELNKNIFKRDNLKLYYRFNEPPSNYTNVSIVIDSSGNSLHSQIKYVSNPTTIVSVNDAISLRSISNIVTPMTEEDINFSPVLFPDHEDTTSLRKSLMEEANIYDENNPNLIFKLFPKHLFDGQSQEEGFDSLYGNISSAFSYQDALAGSLKLPAIGNFVSILIIWARFFDNLKMYIDCYTELINVDYDSLAENKPGSSVFIPKMANFYGFDFQQIIQSPTSRNLLGKDLQYNNSDSEFRIRKIQNSLWKRLLINSQDFIRSKGTIDSLKSTIRNAGIDPDLFYSIREKSGLSEELLNESYSRKKILSKYIDFSSNLSVASSFDNENEEANNKIFFKIDNLNNPTNGVYPETYLSSSEANSLNDSALSGSWTCESFVQFPKENLSLYDLSQSLGRIITTNSDEAIYPIFNVVAKRESLISENATLYFMGRPYNNITGSDIVLSSSNNIPLFNGKIWKVAYGRNKIEKGYRRKSEFFFHIDSCGDNFKNYHSSSQEIYFYNDTLSTSLLDLQEKYDSDYNKVNNNFSFHLGDFYFSSSVGSLDDTTLSKITDPGVSSLTTNFQGLFFGSNIYSLNLDKKTLDDHSKDIESAGVLLARKNYLFIDSVTGSNQRLISKTDFKTNISSSWDGTLNKAEILDYTQNLNISSSISHRDQNKLPESFVLSKKIVMQCLNTSIDDSIEENKVRILKSDNNSIYRRQASDKVNEDNRLIVEISNVNLLNKDISKIISSLDEFNNCLGDSSTLFDVQYKTIVNLREIYFKHLIEEIDDRSLYFIYKYMDNLLSDLLKSLIPDKVVYSNHNYTITSHSLERHKIQYKYNESRLPETFRTAKSFGLNRQNRLK